MEVTALCRLVMTVFLLLEAHVAFINSQKSDAAFPQVDPNSQQLFAHDSFSVSCEGLQGLTGWRVMRMIKGKTITCAPTWLTSTGPCRIETAYPDMDSGTYWCEMGGRKKSNTVNITVTAGPVILESPVLPVMEGDAVTLSCRRKQTSINFTADFYKDGYFMDSSSTGNFTIDSVSESNEGLYKCSISGAGESPESWLAVGGAEEELQDVPQLYLLISIGVCAFLLVLLLFVGSLRCRKRQTITTDTPTSPSSLPSISSPQIVTDEAPEDVPFQPTYAAIAKPGAENGYDLVTETHDEDEPSLMPVYHTLSLVNV
ncbi:low affinity immunoglobulin gamma Fc region receptor II-b-like [Centropristis striata]|uniref:low affinity immunoglobulin gamma Fc region receptor II-b-like n=1 Tax=Centropristis striata TaxID=184440 RepID=UPI0027E06E30|nr:low affinity immunoglobulin gamma Fc region receptor II-b-like [Centropristis striata]